MTAQEYLERERLAETKSEFYGGEMFAKQNSDRVLKESPAPYTRPIFVLLSA